MSEIPTHAELEIVARIAGIESVPAVKDMLKAISQLEALVESLGIEFEAQSND